MYDKDDVQTLTQRFLDCIAVRKSMNPSAPTMIMKENKNLQPSSSIISSGSSTNLVMPLRPAKLTRDEEIKLKKQQ